MSRKIAVIGTGFVGAAYGAALAEYNNQVMCADINGGRIDACNAFCANPQDNRFPVYEPGLEQLVQTGHARGLLSFTEDVQQAIWGSDIVFIAVGTPPQDPKSEKSPADLGYVKGAAHKIGKILKESGKYLIVVNKSTVPVKTAQMVEEILAQYVDPSKFDVVSNPEFLAEGTAVADCKKPSRIVVGTRNPDVVDVFRDLYGPFIENAPHKLFAMSPESAELTKYFSNTYLAMQVVLTNAFANFSRLMGGDWYDQIRPAIAADPRIGRFLYPGLGYGGSCFGKDVAELLNMMKKGRLNSAHWKLLDLGIDQNRHQKLELNRRLADILQTQEFPGHRVAVWGTAFKPRTNDFRDAASLSVIPDLLRRGAIVRMHDPKVDHGEFVATLQEMGVDTTRLTHHTDEYEAARDANSLMILTEWRQYRTPKYDALAHVMAFPRIFDGKDILKPKDLIEQGFNCYAIGRPDIVI
ncbi:UDP-glucose/GDP-mannose dehydrogenase family protein [archaeon]|jgi:UDPglucose 6-dehydrogenase|nr:UDP-glucose/GDP-mannose dehydrogenase family protein [archaeon]MBT4441040.1 UDP-glucose/GDP-mannose dehydrogenase family protein [archaeon]